jgi:hypothetical protein
VLGLVLQQVVLVIILGDGFLIAELEQQEVVAGANDWI